MACGGLQRRRCSRSHHARAQAAGDSRREWSEREGRGSGVRVALLLDDAPRGLRKREPPSLPRACVDGSRIRQLEPTRKPAGMGLVLDSIRQRQRVNALSNPVARRNAGRCVVRLPRHQRWLRDSHSPRSDACRAHRSLAIAAQRRDLSDGVARVSADVRNRCRASASAARSGADYAQLDQRNVLGRGGRCQRIVRQHRRFGRGLCGDDRLRPRVPLAVATEWRLVTRRATAPSSDPRSRLLAGARCRL